MIKITPRPETLEQAWDNFLAIVIPTGVDPKIVDMFRSTFFAGAAEVLSQSFIKDGEPEGDVEARATRLCTYHDEVRAWMDGALRPLYSQTQVQNSPSTDTPQ